MKYLIPVKKEVKVKTKKEQEDDKEFESIVEYIREHGVKEKFEGKEYIYLHLGDFKYWTMGEAVKDTILINRAKI